MKSTKTKSGCSYLQVLLLVLELACYSKCSYTATKDELLDLDAVSKIESIRDDGSFPQIAGVSQNDFPISSNAKTTFSAEAKKFLVGWPTIPVPYKGSDSRALYTIKFLKNAGFEVDLIFWRNFAVELGNPHHDDQPDRQRLAEVGVKNIFGPFDEVPLSQSNMEAVISDYFAFVFWNWPDGPYLECLHDFVNHIKTLNGATHIVAAVDDIGVAVRLLYSMDMKNENPENKNLKNIENFLLVEKRHPDLLGTEATDFVRQQPRPITFKDGLFSPIYLFHLEMYLYAIADVSVGLNDHIVNYLKKVLYMAALLYIYFYRKLSITVFFLLFPFLFARWYLGHHHVV